MRPQNRYAAIIEQIFFKGYHAGATEITFQRDEIEEVARDLGIALPKNLGDIIYSFRYRVSMPERILQVTPAGYCWLIRPAGRSRYRFVLSGDLAISPSSHLAETKIPDATPGIISMYALSDEQALLAKLRYNRLIDLFTGVTCYSLQNHLQTQVKDVGQIEIDELYVGVDRRGAHYAIPIQAKGGRDKINIVQIEQDHAYCRFKFPLMLHKPIAAQFIASDLIALFAFEMTDDGLRVQSERHYRLVDRDGLSDEDIEGYRSRSDEA